MKSYVFYAGQIYAECDSDHVLRQIVSPNSPEIYNGCYIYFPKAVGVQWFRGDLTPVLIEDVPKDLRVTVLLLT